MAQRVAIAAARAGGARIVIADEPTKGLDAARRDDVATLLLAEMGETGGLLVITHDLALARRLGGRLIVLRGGEVVEQGACQQVFAVRARPIRAPSSQPIQNTGRHGNRPVRDAPAVVSAQDLSVSRGGKTLFDGISVAIAPGQVFGVTGPSGCGKSSLGDALLGLVRADRGTVTRRPGDHPHAFQKLYQDPVSAFPRKRSIGQTLADTAKLSVAIRAISTGIWTASALTPACCGADPVPSRAANCNACPCFGSCCGGQVSSSPMNRPRGSIRSHRKT